MYICASYKQASGSRVEDQLSGGSYTHAAGSKAEDQSYRRQNQDASRFKDRRIMDICIIETCIRIKGHINVREHRTDAKDDIMRHPGPPS